MGLGNVIFARTMFTEKLNNALVAVNRYCFARAAIVEGKIIYVVNDYFTDTFTFNISRHARYFNNISLLC